MRILEEPAKMYTIDRLIERVGEEEAIYQLRAWTNETGEAKDVVAELDLNLHEETRERARAVIDSSDSLLSMISAGRSWFHEQLQEIQGRRRVLSGDNLVHLTIITKDNIEEIAMKLGWKNALDFLESIRLVSFDVFNLAIDAREPNEGTISITQLSEIEARHQGIANWEETHILVIIREADLIHGGWTYHIHFESARAFRVGNDAYIDEIVHERLFTP